MEGMFAEVCGGNKDFASWELVVLFSHRVEAKARPAKRDWVSAFRPPRTTLGGLTLDRQLPLNSVAVKVAGNVSFPPEIQRSGTNATGGGTVERSISTVVVAELGPWVSFEVP